MGPVIILDKSTFQSLSRREHRFLHIYCEENLTPILGLELLGDLMKEGPGSRTAEQRVTELAGKFGGSGPVTNVDYRTLCIQSLMGNHFPLDGGIVPQSAQPVTDSDGSRGLVIDLSPLNQAILRWGRGEFEQFEKQFAGFWRHVTRSLDFESFKGRLDAHHVILPQVSNTVELEQVVESLLATESLQNVWLSWLMDQLAVPEALSRAVWARWRSRSTIFLRNFSPMSWHCVRVMLALAVATRHALLRWDATNILDIQYLYYLPFCMAFSSHDHVHRFLCPVLLRDDQTFISGIELKEALGRIIIFRDGLTEEKRRMLGFALGVYPPPMRDSVVYDLWKKLFRPWRPGMGNAAISLSQSEQQEAIRWVTELFEEVEGKGYLDRFGEQG